MEVPFADFISLLYPIVVPFLLVLVRVMGLFAFVPLFSNAAVPGNVKALLGIAVTVCIWGVVPKGTPPDGLIGLALAVMGELSVGLLIGLLTALVMMGIQLGGNLISQQMGLSTAAAYDPMFDQQSTVIEQFAFWLSLMVFFALGGHRELINTLVMSYQSVPLGRGLDPQMMLDTALSATATAFTIAVKIAAPTLVVFFLTTITTGFISKSMPQINIMTLGLGLHLIIGMAMIFVCAAAWAMVSTRAWQDFFHTLENIFGK